VRQREDGTIEVADALDTLEQPCYDMRGLTRNLDFVSTVSRNVTALGWDNYATDHEDANGQFEQNFQFDDALVTCDRAVFFRYMVEALAQERGLIATFMPKPFAHLTGNGCHFHMSLWKDGENLFEADPSDDPRGLGLSELAYQFVGGLKAHAKAYIAVTAPTVTSYKRLVVGARRAARRGRRPTSATATTTARRCCASRPRAHRGPHVDGSCNPYLAGDGVLAAGPGRHRARPRPGRAELAEPLRDRRGQREELGIDVLPANLLDATRELERCDVLRAALGRARDEDYVDYYVRCKRASGSRRTSRSPQWEIDRYLQLF
jgi:glutamine synthetase